MKKILLAIVCLWQMGMAEVDMEKPVSLEESLRITAEVMNQNLPAMVDAELRHDKVRAEGKKMTFDYTLVNFTLNVMNAQRLRGLMYDDLKHQVCQDAETREMLKEGMVVVYSYTDRDARPITSIRFDEIACRK